ncbi:calpain 7 [Tulasnella sp. 424]|nr:calpain 7 [Tulasnella sp. 424]KAG8975700.1 calpain 7 [Tulasnella sp. 425]
MASDGTLNFQEAEAALAKAAVKASQQDLDAAYDLYVRAAKAFLHLARTTASNSGGRTQSAVLSARCRENAAKALERAEQIKARRSTLGSQSSGGTRKPPATRNLAVNVYSIVIDDALPATDEGLLLCASTRGTRVLWPSIIEKAYMKVMGGYDFPGS